MADGPDAFWALLEAGVEAVVPLDAHELLAAGEDPRWLGRAEYVPVHGVLADADLFDAQFFGMSPGEAALTDPQHRIFLECAWSAFEDAGYDPQECAGPVGVYAGSGWNAYFLRNVAARAELMEPGALQRTLLGNEADTLATRVSYKLGLRGPSLTVQTACSTSLVAVAQACQSLLTHESDMALAGGVSIRTPQAGYLHQDGSIFSRGGHCRAFDAGADGTVIGSGAGVVLLKRLDDAIADGDHVHAVIKAAAINNDGSLKAGYAAPSVDGQAAVIREAQALAGVSAETITYVETHGTGTVVGDPIEMAALTEVFRSDTERTGFCAVGSVKTNTGHLDAAAGIASLIKTILSLRHRKIPASLNFDRPNPAIDFEVSPFYVNTETAEWNADAPRRAGVSSFGIGGTNAHVVLEEFLGARSSGRDGVQLLPLSARTPHALERRSGQLLEYLRESDDTRMADIAHTLQHGRRAFEYRRVVVGSAAGGVVEQLRAPAAGEGGPAFLKGRRAAFMFSGQGPQHVGMARCLYAADPVFRAQADRCFDLLRDRHGLDLRELIYPVRGSVAEKDGALLDRTRFAQPALFTVQYSLARTLEHYGVPMASGVGHSFGEYAAATLAGVFTVQDALDVVVARGQVLSDIPAGAMMAVPLAPADTEPLLGTDLSIAVVNHPASCVVAGARDAIVELQRRLAAREVDATILRISYASHTPMVEPALGAFARHVEKVDLNPPRVPVLSSVTGTWLTDKQATDPGYWVSHLRERVRFADGLERVLHDTDHVLVELGPNEVLTGLAKRHPAGGGGRVAAPALPHRSANDPDDEVFLRSVGSLWCSGVDVAWGTLHRGAPRRRVPLPTYPFARERHWIDPPVRGRAAARESFDVALQESLREAEDRIHAQAGPLRREKVRVLEQLAGAYMRDALRSLGDGPPEGVVPAFRPLVSDWLDETSRTARGPGEAEGPDALLARAREVWQDAPEVELVHRCGAALPDVLRGALDPVDLFTPVLDQAFDHPERIFGTEYAAVIRSALSGVLQTPGAPSGLRVLEIGGGTGITTGGLVRELAGDGGDHHYVFTDLSDAFVGHAGRRYGDVPWFRAMRLDIEVPPAEQGIACGTFDVVVAANVLHATSDLRRTLDHVRSLLAPGGLLLLAEITTPTLDFAMTYGLLMGAVSDPDRSRSTPFLAREAWTRELGSVFRSVGSAPEDDSLGHHVFVARAAGEPPRRDDRLSRRNDVGRWFRVPSWKRSAAVRPVAGPPTRTGTCLVLEGRTSLAASLQPLLRDHGVPVVTVRPGAEYRRLDDTLFEIRPEAIEDHRRLLSELAAEGRGPTRIVHTWATALVDDPEVTTEQTGSLQRWRSVLALAAAVDDAGLAEGVDLTVVSAGLHDVLGEQTRVDQSLLLGPCRVIPLEFPAITCRSVDFAVGASPGPAASRLAGEVLADRPDPVVAYRGEHRWVETVESLSLDRTDGSSMLRSDGVYLITGGFGTIGSHLARHLVERVGARVVLVGRSGGSRPSDEAAPWYVDCPQVLACAADVTDAEAMREVVRLTEERFGPIDGVVHSAGLLGDGSILHKTVEEVERVLAPKVTGTLVLHELFRDRGLDFLVLFSSLSARAPGFGQVAYAAANCFVDSFVHSAAATAHPFVTCINWDVWHGSGMAYDASGPAVLQHLKLADFAERGILPEQGVDAFCRALDSGMSQVYITSSDYLEVLDEQRQDLSQVYLAALEHENVRHHPRPEPDATYIGPRTATEEMLAEIWQSLLGIDRIGISDDFFGLGGDSLLGSQFITRVRSAFGIQLSSRSLYENPTITGMAEVVDDALIGGADPESIAEAIRQITNER